MMRENRDLVAGQSVGVTVSVNPLVVMPDDTGDLRVGLDLPEDVFPDRRVILHQSTLFERERTHLLEQTCRQPDLADVMNESAQVRELLSLVG